MKERERDRRVKSGEYEKKIAIPLYVTVLNFIGFFFHFYYMEYSGVNIESPVQVPLKHTQFKTGEKGVNERKRVVVLVRMCT